MTVFLSVAVAFVASAVATMRPAEADPQTGTVLAGRLYPTGPNGSGRGMAFDGINLYYTIYGDSNIYQITTTGLLLNTIAIPGGDPRVSAGGPLAWDGTYLWTVDYSNALLMYQVNPATGATMNSCSIAGVNPAHPALSGLDFPDGLHWTGSLLSRSPALKLMGTACPIASTCAQGRPFPRVSRQQDWVSTVGP